MRYDVTAMSINPKTGEVVYPPTVERIDTETNELFSACENAWDVEDVYTAFWNRLDESWQQRWPRGKDKVVVVSVKKVRGRQRQAAPTNIASRRRSADGRRRVA